MKKAWIVEDRLCWLELARKQSQAQAEEEASNWEPFRWESAMRREERIGWLTLWGSLFRHSVWAHIVLAALILGGATGTLAFVHHLKATKLALSSATKAGAPAAKSTPSFRVPRRPAPSSVPGISQPPAAVVPKGTSTKRALRWVPQKQAVSPSSALEPQSLSDGGNGILIYSPEEMPGGGELILVNPVRKQKPIWTPEEYQQKGLWRGPGW